MGKNEDQGTSKPVVADDLSTDELASGLGPEMPEDDRSLAERLTAPTPNTEVTPAPGTDGPRSIHDLEQG